MMKIRLEENILSLDFVFPQPREYKFMSHRRNFVQTLACHQENNEFHLQEILHILLQDKEYEQGPNIISICEI